MYRQSEKNLLSSNISSTRPHNMVNFGPLAAEIVALVWGTPANFNGFRVLAALLHGTLVVGVSQTAALNKGRHLYSAGRPSSWALAHISSFVLIPTTKAVVSCAIEHNHFRTWAAILLLNNVENELGRGNGNCQRRKSSRADVPTLIPTF